jgi:hypothetical protein
MKLLPSGDSLLRGVEGAESHTYSSNGDFSREMALRPQADTEDDRGGMVGAETRRHLDDRGFCGGVETEKYYR